MGQNLHRRLVDFAALEARRLFCAEGFYAHLDATIGHSDHTPRAVAMSAPPNLLPVPAYDSHPTAPLKIYLDFNGHGAFDNWGGWSEFGGKNVSETPAFDNDGNSNSFSQQELADIHTIWKGVAEKFSPFNVNVTTVDPGPINGARVVIGGDGAWNDGGGGVAQVGGWGEEGFTDVNSGNVCFVWGHQDNPTYVAEAAAHEVGHTLGLRHLSLFPIADNEYADGFIMGDGDAGIGRWGTTNAVVTSSSRNDDDVVINEGGQDDLARITSGNGFGYRLDDVPSSFPGGHNLLPLSIQDGARQGSATGVIHSTGDSDRFRVDHTGGSFEVQVDAAEFRGMLDPQLVLRDSSDTLVTFSLSNSAGGVAERISLSNLDPGAYYIVVTSAGGYGNIGQYRVNVRAGLSAPAVNDTLSTATSLGLFGGTSNAELVQGFAGTATINDSLASTDQYDYFRLVAPLHTSSLYARLTPSGTTASVAIYEDLNANGVVEVGEIVFATNPSTGTQQGSVPAVGRREYVVRVARQSGAASGNYQLRITADSAPSSLPPGVTATTFDRPVRGASTAYGSIDHLAGDQTDYFRLLPERSGLLNLRTFMQVGADADLRLDVGRDTNGNGVIDGVEFQASGISNGTGFETLSNIPITANTPVLIRVTQQAVGASGNYSLEAVTDYATGGNSTGVLSNARDQTGRAAATITEYLGDFDTYDTYRIAPAPGTLQASIAPLGASGNHRLEVIRDLNFNNTVDAGEVVASGFNTTLTYNVTIDAPYYLRVTSVLAGEFFTVGNYELAYRMPGSVTGSTFGSPTSIAVSPAISQRTGHTAFEPDNATLTNLDDFCQFTVASRTRFDASVGGAQGIGLQIGRNVGGVFQRLAGVGRAQGVMTDLMVNLDPGTYLLRAYLRTPERQDEPIGGDYTISYRSTAVTDNSPPTVIATSTQFEISPVGVVFVTDQDVAGSIDAADLVLRNLATNVTYPIGKVFYDPPTRRIGYGVAQGTLPDGNYRATLLAGALRDLSANPLAADASHDFFILAGDANRDRTVNIDDFGVLASRFNLPGTFSQGDFNYDHVTNIDDFGILASKFNTSLPVPRSAAIGTGAASARTDQDLPRIERFFSTEPDPVI